MFRTVKTINVDLFDAVPTLQLLHDLAYLLKSGNPLKFYEKDKTYSIIASKNITYQFKFHHHLIVRTHIDTLTNTHEKRYVAISPNTHDATGNSTIYQTKTFILLNGQYLEEIRKNKKEIAKETKDIYEQLEDDLQNEYELLKVVSDLIPFHPKITIERKLLPGSQSEQFSSSSSSIFWKSNSHPEICPSSYSSSWDEAINNNNRNNVITNHDRTQQIFNQSPPPPPFLFQRLFEGIPGDEFYKKIINKEENNLEKILQIMRTLAWQVFHIHQRGILHHDIKLDNFIENHYKTKIIDFGLAMKEENFKNDQLGTVPYIDPELFQDGEISYRSDIYALGVTYLYLAGGKIDYFCNNSTYTSYQRDFNLTLNWDEFTKTELITLITCMLDKKSVQELDEGVLQDDSHDNCDDYFEADHHPEEKHEALLILQFLECIQFQKLEEKYTSEKDILKEIFQSTQTTRWEIMFPKEQHNFPKFIKNFKTILNNFFNKLEKDFSNLNQDDRDPTWKMVQDILHIDFLYLYNDPKQAKIACDKIFDEFTANLKCIDDLQTQVSNLNFGHSNKISFFISNKNEDKINIYARQLDKYKFFKDSFTIDQIIDLNYRLTNKLKILTLKIKLFEAKNSFLKNNNHIDCINIDIYHTIDSYLRLLEINPLEQIKQKIISQMNSTYPGFLTSTVYQQQLNFFEALFKSLEEGNVSDKTEIKMSFFGSSLV